MALKMAQPWKHPKTGYWHLRERTPADLLPRVRSLTVTLPVHKGFAKVKIGAMVQVSLGTKDDKEAKELHPAASLALKKFWLGQRSGPMRLTFKEAVALAGTLYKVWTEVIGKDPGSPEFWELVEETNQSAREGVYGPHLGLMIDDGRGGENINVTASREVRYGAFADALIAREGLNLDSPSRTLVLKAVQAAMEKATTRLKANANFDFSPDKVAESFPEWTPPADAKPPAPTSKDKLTAEALFDAWKAFMEPQGIVAASTVKRYRTVFKFLGAYLKGRDLNSLTAADMELPRFGGRLRVRTA